MKRQEVLTVWGGVMSVFAALSSQSAAAGVVNGDFSEGFLGWKGEVTDVSFVTTPVDPPPGAFPGNFDTSSGAAVLSTSTLADGIFSVFLFQEFTVVSTAMPVLLSYDIAAHLSDTTAGDTAFAQLSYGPGFSNVLALPLVDTSDFDISFLAGETVEILFGVDDLDDIGDAVTVDNIEVKVVPIPGVLPLFATGLVALAGLARRGRKATE